VASSDASQKLYKINNHQHSHHTNCQKNPLPHTPIHTDTPRKQTHILHILNKQKKTSGLQQRDLGKFLHLESFQTRPQCNQHTLMPRMGRKLTSLLGPPFHCQDFTLLVRHSSVNQPVLTLNSTII